MHDAFCSAGDNMCGGSFEHIRSDDHAMSAIIKNLAVDGSAQPMNEEGEGASGSKSSQDTPMTTQERSTISKTSSQIVYDDSVPEFSSSSRMTRSKSIASKKTASLNDAQESVSSSSLKTTSISTSSKPALSKIDLDAAESTSSRKTTSKSSSNKVKPGAHRQKSVTLKGGKHAKLQVVDNDIEVCTDILNFVKGLTHHIRALPMKSHQYLKVM